MSNYPPTNYNTNSTFNKYKGTYFNNTIDISGGDIIIRNGNLYLSNNSNIYSLNNQIQFDDTYSFTNFINSINVYGQLKNTYNSIEYDVGLQCFKTDNLIDDVATLSPIVSDTAFKCTNFYYDQASNSTVWSGLLTCPISSIASTAIANTTRFIEGTGNQNVGGIKRFTSNIRIDAAMVVNNNTLTITNAQLQLIPNIATLNTKTTDITYTAGTTTTNIINNTSLFNVLFSGNINTFTKAQFDNAINYAKDLTSSAQTQINTINSNITTLQNGSVSLSALNTFSGATNTFTNNIRHDGSLLLNAGALTITNANLQKLQYISTITSDIQTQTTTNATNITNLNTSVSTLNTKTTKMSYMSVGGINTTTILDGLISQTFSFTGTINNISTTTFGYLSGATSNLQTQINNFTGVSLSANNSFTGSNTFANITFTGTLNNIIPTVFSYLSNLSGNIQDQFNTLATKLTAISYSTSTTTTTITNSINFTGSLNTISATTFGYLYGLTGAIQDQLNALSTRIATFEITGTIIMSPLSNIQTTSSNKYLLCNGQTVSRSTYANLFAVIGTNFGSGDGSTTFTLPNYQGLFLRGMGSQTINGTVYTGVSVINAQQDSLENHNHEPQSGAYLGTITSASNSGGYISSAGLQRPNQYSFGDPGDVKNAKNNDFETRPVNVGIYYYIKT
jgi:microcystin-dependent protein